VAGYDKTVLVNGEATRTPAQTLAELLEQLGFQPGQVATALNSEFVPRHMRAQTRISGDDKVEIVAPRQGG
jgi:sulfur carrier protein